MHLPIQQVNCDSLAARGHLQLRTQQILVAVDALTFVSAASATYVCCSHPPMGLPTSDQTADC
jgi:hypothetical protein